MKRSWVVLLALFSGTLLACAGPQPHRFVFDYSPPQALRMIRELLREQGYRMAIFDEPAGMLKTQPREFEGQEGELVRYQISVTVVKRHELVIRVMPYAIADYRDQLMETLIGPLGAVGIHPKFIPPPPSRPRRWRRPPLPIP